MARPTKYSEELLDIARDYLKNFRKHGDFVPSVEGLADTLDIHRDTVYDWKDKYDEFSDIYKKVLTKQARGLINGGLSNEFNASTTKMMLTKHGYSDRIETDISSSDGSMKPTVIELVGVRPDGD